MAHIDLMAGPPAVLLPVDPAAAELAAGTDPVQVARDFPSSPAAWAVLATAARENGADDITVYAYSRVGYHRSLDILRRNGWKGHGPVPWSHEPNRGFLSCLALLSLSAALIGEDDEAERCSSFLKETSAEAWENLLG